MKLSISNIAWSKEFDEEMIAFIKQSKFEGLEIAPTRIFPLQPYQRLEDARKWSKDIGLMIPSMQSIWYGHTEKIFGSEEERAILIDYTKQAIRFAEAIGCPNLVFGNPKNRETLNVKEDLAIAIDFFREIGDYAATHKTTIAIEPNPTIYNTHFINTTKEAVEIAKKVQSKGFKVNVDLGTIIYNEESLDYLSEIPEWINHVHISEPYLKTIERRDMHRDLFAILKEIGYGKYVSIEMGNQNNIDSVKEVMKYIQDIYETI